MLPVQCCPSEDEPHAAQQSIQSTRLTQRRFAVEQSTVRTASAGEIWRPHVPSTADHLRTDVV
eukprot:7508281-Lingulodinium_polyedra.AAC.1